MFYKNVIKSLTAVVFSTAILASASAELSVSGHVRAGAAVNTDAESIETSTWMGGNYFGGGSRSRIEISYDGNFGGATFRYTNSDFENFLDSGCIDWAMAYANFLDGKVIAEAGKITDRFTSSAGWEDTALDGGKGVRVVVTPVENLFLTASATDANAEKYEETDSKVKDGKAQVGDLKFNKNILAFSAKYGTDAFFVTAAYSPAKLGYASFGFTAVENLTFVVEGIYDGTADSDAEDNTELCFWAEYTGIKNFTIGGIVSYFVADSEYYDAGNTKILINPAVAYNLTDVVKLSAEASYNVYDCKTKDDYFTVTPAVTFTAGKASATVYATISSDDDYEKTTIGTGVRYDF